MLSCREPVCDWLGVISSLVEAGLDPLADAVPSAELDLLSVTVRSSDGDLVAGVSLSDCSPDVDGDLERLPYSLVIDFLERVAVRDSVSSSVDEIDWVK